MDVHAIETRIHGRYLVAGPTGPAPLLVGFHGFMENASRQLDVLRAIAGARPWRLVSVQALHRFYTRTSGGAIGACWMTTEDRETAIADNIAYVEAVVAEVERAYGPASRLVYAGFSQGVAMAYRAAVFVPRRCDGLIVLAGDVPPDVAPLASGLPRILIGRGSADKYYTPEIAARDRESLATANVEFSEHVFDGGHNWHESFVARAGAFLDERIAT